MEIQIVVASSGKTLKEVKEALESQANLAGADAQLELRQPKTKFRSIDPTLLVAIVGAAGTGISALITGLFQIRQQMAAKKFVLETHDGRKLEVPANTPVDQIDHLLEKLGQTSDVKKISIE